MSVFDHTKLVHVDDLYMAFLYGHTLVTVKEGRSISNMFTVNTVRIEKDNCLRTWVHVLEEES